MKFLAFYGPRAVGKLTVAQELSKLTGFKLFYGHLTMNAVSPIFEWGSDSYKRVLPEVRRIIVDEAARADVSLIFSFVYSPSRKHVSESYFKTIEKAGGEVCLVRLFAAKAVTEQRVTNASRAEAGKMHTVEELRAYLQKLNDLDQPIRGRDSLELDTGLTPIESAKAVISHYNLV